MIKSNRGQLSIFMGITLIIVMGMLAFIINIGLFVKAKINLQNAVDAAAFAGAATQSRQLTNIAYANWELRNTYKEWMFKYYVLGQLGLFPYNLKNIDGNGAVNFILPTPPISGFKDSDFDKYNIPSICIHNNSKTNICPIFALPGIPRFPAIGVAGISEIHEAFVNKLVEEKGKDCSRRSKANFLTALTWAYGAGGGATIPDAPLVASNRPGAWPQALELAFRIRNLEMIVNRPPVAEVSIQNIEQLNGQATEIGFNERPIKAFWSAYRNLGGGVYKDKVNPGCTGAVDELSCNLKLTELSPQPYSASPNSVSGFLIPPNFSYPGDNGGSALQKHYLDLQLMPTNLATMFSTFVDTANNNADMNGVAMEAACGISKTALPVPGYIIGFNKNPEVLTYYAVKAESKFIGLFFPIGDSPGIKLTAYAAAKPFGGRIGPKLFAFGSDNQTVMARADINQRSSSYINGLKIEVGAAAGFRPGMPIPSSSNFWVNDLNPNIGGVPGTGAPIFYGIPNMIYDFESEDDLSLQTQSGSSKIQLISNLAFKNQAPKENLGLYHTRQFKALKNSIGLVNPGTSMSGDEVLKAIIRARRPTKYDAINYLVPDFKEMTENNNASPMVQQISDVLNAGMTYKLFAPLMGPNLLYKTNNDVETIVTTYMDANAPAVDTYLSSLLDVSNSIFNIVSQGDNKEAARSIHVNAGTGIARPDFLISAPANSPGCKTDLASKFYHFFRAEQTGCGIIPLKNMMIDFIANASANEGGIDKSLFYIGYYYYEPGSALTLPAETVMTAYFPGTRQGTNGNKGIAEHPLKLTSGVDSYSTKRNFYSTKFFHMAKVLDSVPSKNPRSTRGYIDYQAQPSLRESDKEFPADLVGTVQLKNPLKYSEVGNNPYFLDF